jgi:hypothetical protein
MVNWQQFTLNLVQTAMFTPDHSAFVGSRVVATIMRQFAERFNGEMQALPIPLDFPPEVPRVVLQSSDGAWRVNAGPARIDCVWTRSAAAPLMLHEAVPQCVEVLKDYVSERKVRVGRLSLIAQRVCPNENPAEALIQRFCNQESQSEPFNRSANFEIHNHKEYTPGRSVDYPINSWVRCQCGFVIPEKTRAILVTQDLNTMAPELESRQFDADQIGGFFSVVCDEAEAIISEYFPERERSHDDD